MHTHNITKKKPRRLNSIDSSSSAETEPSKPPKDVLELGKHLVRELGFEDSVDTLGRWMAHHVAELIEEAKNGITAAERAKAGKRATETILKIWEHRKSLPGETYPLTNYKNVLIVLQRLRPDENPFRYFNHHVETKRGRLASDLFDRLTRLIIALLLIKGPTDVTAAKADSVAVEALNEDEQYILNTIDQWYEVLAPALKNSGPTKKRKKDEDASKINLIEVAVQFIDDAATTLVELRNELQIAEDKVSEEEISE